MLCVFVCLRCFAWLVYFLRVFCLCCVLCCRLRLFVVSCGMVFLLFFLFSCLELLLSDVCVCLVVLCVVCVCVKSVLFCCVYLCLCVVVCLSLLCNCLLFVVRSCCGVVCLFFGGASFVVSVFQCLR